MIPEKGNRNYPDLDLLRSKISFVLIRSVGFHHKMQVFRNTAGSAGLHVDAGMNGMTSHQQFIAAADFAPDRDTHALDFGDPAGNRQKIIIFCT